MKVVLVGALGKMGKCVRRELEKRHVKVLPLDKKSESERGNGESGQCAEQDVFAHDLTVYHSFSEIDETVDAVMDFSSRDSLEGVLKFAKKKNIPAVLGTTGYGESEMNMIASAAEDIAVFQASNMSFGAYKFIELAKSVARALKYAEVEIIETHHSGKKDVPSGTALEIANAIRVVRGGEIVTGRSGERKRGEIAISSLRIGEDCGTHEVIFDTAYQRISLKHVSKSREMYAVGACNALQFILKKEKGLFGLEDLAKGE